jgi:secreted PhoX family phosphatase
MFIISLSYSIFYHRVLCGILSQVHYKQFSFHQTSCFLTRVVSYINFQSYTNNTRNTATSADEIQKEFRLQGVSVIEVNKVNGKFEVNKASAFNRRITTLTPMVINGPLKGHASQVTKYSPTGNEARGTLNNCASGYTPW